MDAYRVDETIDVGSNFWVDSLSLFERAVVFHGFERLSSALVLNVSPWPAV